MHSLKNGFFKPWLQPGKQRKIQTVGLQPLKELKAKAEKDAEKNKPPG